MSPQPPPPPTQDNNIAVAGRVTRAQTVTDYQALDKKLDLIISQLEEVKSDSSLIKGDIVNIKNDLQQFKEDVTRTTDMCFDELKVVKANIEGTNAELVKHDGEIDFLKCENSKLKQEVGLLKKRLNAADQYSRCNCLEIQGVPENTPENVLGLVIKVASVLNFDLQPSMVDAVHRLAPNNRNDNTPRSIIVKFCRRMDMEEMRRKAIRKRGFSATNLGFSSQQLIYVNLAMTRETRILWAETRKYKIENQYKFAWITSSGKIFLRKSEKDRPILIEDKSDFPRPGLPSKPTASSVTASVAATNTSTAALNSTVG